MDLQDLGLGVVDWIHLAQVRGRLKALLKTLMNLQFENCAFLDYYAVSSGNFFCRRFVTTYRSHLHGSTSEDGPDRLSRNVYEIATTRVLISQTSAVLICFAAEA